MSQWLLDRIICPGCLGFKLGPSHLFRKFIFGIECDHT